MTADPNALFKDGHTLRNEIEDFLYLESRPAGPTPLR